MTPDDKATLTSDPGPVTSEVESHAEAVVEDFDPSIGEDQPPHPLTVNLRAAGDSAIRLAEGVKATAVTGAQIAQKKLVEASDAGVRTAKRVPGKAWVAVGIGVAATGLAILVLSRRSDPPRRSLARTRRLLSNAMPDGRFAVMFRRRG
ncbi:hypothetical protein FB566_2302 [Stackebrandtia endophytica]|uniref:Uncharacterized protein n=1 Tax=Stackebrandtia endophytica TaxID=1496996 RepID=A0A543AW03_9ACTN|nr:hypothetical protein [Stackebrandtia endophytica]TQL76765.1 hypothetical protein FB566_2302 [Stackebrandtia endophytica]